MKDKIRKAKIYTLAVPLAAMVLACNKPKAEVAPAELPKTEVPKEPVVMTTSEFSLVTIKKSQNTIGPWNINGIIPKIKKMSINPAVISMAVGEQYSVSKLNIECLDENNNSLGRLIFFDIHSNPQGTRVSNQEIITAVSPGEYIIKFMPPFYYRAGGEGPIPQAELKVIVE